LSKFPVLKKEIENTHINRTSQSRKKICAYTQMILMGKDKH